MSRVQKPYLCLLELLDAVEGLGVPRGGKDLVKLVLQSPALAQGPDGGEGNVSWEDFH